MTTTAFSRPRTAPSNTGLDLRLYLKRGHSADGFQLDIDITLPGSGITALFGPSGSGKTTVLRCIAGLERPDVGHCHVNGSCWQREGFFLAPHRRAIGYVFQEASLFPHLSAEDNLRYAMKRGRCNNDDGHFHQLVALMALGPLLKRLPHTLSGGERQRVAIARALLVAPDILLMDEPLAALDTRRKLDVLPYLENLRSELQVPVIYVSHAIEEVMRLADSAVVLEQGKVVAQGPVSNVFSRPDTLVTADGDAGVIWEGVVTSIERQWQLMSIRCGDVDIWLPASGYGVGDTSRLRILASDVSIALSNHNDSSILNRFPATVTHIVQLPEEPTVLVHLQVGRQTLSAKVTCRSAEHLGLNTGSQVWAQIKSAAISR